MAKINSTALRGRSAGLLLHPSSLPGPGPGPGGIGVEALNFLGFLRDAGISVWQMLPLGPTHGAFASPYQCLSTHAGNPDLICRQTLADWGWLRSDQIAAEQALQAARAGFERRADPAEQADFAGFCAQHAIWLEDYALFAALRQNQHGRAWTDWPRALRDRDASALARAGGMLVEAVAQVRFEQFAFYRQWALLRGRAADYGIRLFGDLPIFVAHDSADVWAEPEQFLLDAAGRPRVVAGVPPDYFSATGQRWGNPLYDWDRMRGDGFDWWLRRVRTILEQFDLVRIDHFRGLQACWEIDGDEATAINGRWVEVPGADLLTTINAAFGELPLVAEDLGLITPEVDALREAFGLPGMKVLHFAFGGDSSNPYLPHNHSRDSVVYLGTHDNDTTLGWYAELDEAARERLGAYFGFPREAMPWMLIRVALASVAELAVLSLQDLLELDAEHRMNRPGTSDGNWRWRFDWEQIEAGLPARVRALLETYGRL